MKVYLSIVALLVSSASSLGFCAAECHPPPVDHEHFVVGSSVECAGREDAIAWITHALEDSRTGRVVYLPEAVAVLKAELGQVDDRPGRNKRSLPLDGSSSTGVHPGFVLLPRQGR